MTDSMRLSSATVRKPPSCFVTPLVWHSPVCSSPRSFLSPRRPRVGVFYGKSLRSRAGRYVHRRQCTSPMAAVSEPRPSESVSEASSSLVSDGRTQTNTDQVRLMHLENNTLVFKYGSTTLLIDPWLTAVVLTQGLPDHAHPPTLKTLPRSIPIIAAEDAESLLDSLGFENVTILKHGATVTAKSSDSPSETVTLTGAKGSLVGPPWSNPQLAILFSFGSGDDALRVYHEPHCNHDSNFLKKWCGKLDAVITPVVSARLPLLGNYHLVNGVPAAVKLCKDVRPKTCVGFDNSGGEPVSGVLFKFIEGDGGFVELRKELQKVEELKDIRVVGDFEAMTEFVIAGKGVGDVISK